MSNIVNEFKEFAIKGNVVDMAVGIVIGASFGTIVTSLVNDMIMPIISGLFNIPDFSNLFFMVSGEGTFSSVSLARESGASVIAYGSFINAIFAFLIVAFALFMFVKAINTLKKKENTKQQVPSGPTETELLIEIRDLLKK